MSAMASQITSVSIVYIVCSGADQRKHQSSSPLAIVRGIHWWPVNSSHKGPVTRKMFPFDGVIMDLSRLIPIYSTSMKTPADIPVSINYNPFLQNKHFTKTILLISISFCYIYIFLIFLYSLNNSQRLRDYTISQSGFPDGYPGWVFNRNSTTVRTNGRKKYTCIAFSYWPRPCSAWR